VVMLAPVPAIVSDERVLAHRREEALARIAATDRGTRPAS
jgi:hypothetical protein